MESSEWHTNSSSTVAPAQSNAAERITRQQGMKGNDEEGGTDSQQEHPRGHPLPASVQSHLYHSPGPLTGWLPLGKGGGDSDRVINLLGLLYLGSACCTCYSLSGNWRQRVGGNGR